MNFQEVAAVKYHIMISGRPWNVQDCASCALWQAQPELEERKGHIKFIINFEVVLIVREVVTHARVSVLMFSRFQDSAVVMRAVK